VQYLSALEVCSRRGAIQIHVYLYLYRYLFAHVEQADACCSATVKSHLNINKIRLYYRNAELDQGWNFALKDLWWAFVYFDWSVSMTSRITTTHEVWRHCRGLFFPSRIIIVIISNSSSFEPFCYLLSSLAHGESDAAAASDDNDRNDECWLVALMGLLNHAPDRHLIRVRSVVNMQVPVLRSHGSCYWPPAASSAAQFL